ncbi:MAG: hypothetical protein KDI13_11460, partial [Alphaproteobacteria bacterium]|nr:hypothetical protein [Alphaproteobacteria bacterium]
HILVLDILERFAGFRGAAWLPTNMVLVSVLSLVISYYASAVPGLQIIFGVKFRGARAGSLYPALSRT